MIYVFKCINEDCEAFDGDVEVEQRVNDKHKAKCELCKKSMQRVYTMFAIGLPQGNVSRGDHAIPAARAREIERKRNQKAKDGGGEYWKKEKNPYTN